MRQLKPYIGWFFTAHLSAALLLWLKESLQKPADGTWSHFIANYQTTLVTFFSSPPVYIVFAFMLLMPIWSLFITRRQPLYGTIMKLCATIWLLLMALMLTHVLTFQPWLYWFLYATGMGLMGLMGILYRILTHQETIIIHATDD